MSAPADQDRLAEPAERHSTQDIVRNLVGDEAWRDGMCRLFPPYQYLNNSQWVMAADHDKVVAERDHLAQEVERLKAERRALLNGLRGGALCCESRAGGPYSAQVVFSTLRQAQQCMTALIEFSKVETPST